MGCDIHLFGEKKIGGEWKLLTGLNQSGIDMCKQALENSLDTEYWLDRLEKCKNDPRFIYDERNYAVFSILANVRNGRGFAGCDTGDGYIPIEEPRGLPDDACDFIKARAYEWGGDGHSHSFFTLKELLEYDWNQVSVVRGFVSEEEYVVFKRNGKPNSYCGGVGGRCIMQTSNGNMDGIIANPSLKEEGGRYYTKVEWNESYKDSAGSFYTRTLPLLKGLAGGDLESVRIVFWFDN